MSSINNLKFENVTLGYEKNTVLENLSFEADNNENIFIIGASGVGKSTLIESVMNKNVIMSGQILWNGEPISKKIKRNNISVLSQVDFFIPHISVWQNIKNNYEGFDNWFFRFFKIIKKDQIETIYSISEELGIKDILFKKMSNLSGGQKQRVKALVLLLQKKKLIIADEPNSALDISNSQNVMNLILKKEVIKIICLHDLDLIPSNSSRVIAIKDKSIFFDGIKKDIDNKLIKAIYD